MELGTGSQEDRIKSLEDAVRNLRNRVSVLEQPTAPERAFVRHPAQAMTNRRESKVEPMPDAMGKYPAAGEEDPN